MIRNKMAVILAADPMGGIGKDGKMPWNIPGDLARFKKITDGKVVIMGRKTFESLPNVLPNRTHVVVSTSLSFKHDDVFVVDSYEKAVMVAESITPDDSVYFVIGGAAFFDRAMLEASTLYYTVVHQPYNCDTFVKEIDLSFWYIPKDITPEVVYQDADRKIPSHTYVVYRKRCQILKERLRPYQYRYAK